MKLFTPSEIKNTKEGETARNVLRYQESEKSLEDVNRRLVEAEASFRLMMFEKGKEWEKEKKSHDDFLDKMRIEVADLEKRKKIAVEPIELLKKEAQKALDDARTAINKAKQKEFRFDELTDKLEDKLDEVGGREINVERQEERIKREENGIKLQKDQIELMNTKLTEVMSEFLVEKEKKLDELVAKRTELALKERSLGAKEEGLSIKEKALEDTKIRLEDQRQTLERAFQRLNIPINKSEK